MTKSKSNTGDDDWLEKLLAPVNARTQTDDVHPVDEEPREEPSWTYRPRSESPLDAETIAALDAELDTLLDEVISEMRQRRREETAAKSRVVERLEGPYPPGPIWTLDWSKFAPEEILRFWLGKIAHLSKYTDIHTRVPGALTRCEITMLLLMRGCEHDELKAMGMTPNILQRAVRLIKEAVMRGELPRERIPHHIWNAKSVASVKVQRNRKETRGSRWLNADGSYRKPHKHDDEQEEIPEEGDEGHE